MKRIGIIGGGAAGMMAAIAAAREGALVTIFEANDRIGKKILATGNGKCNLSNLNMSMDNYYSSHKEFVEHALQNFDVNEVIRFFNSIGLVIKNKNGYLYPSCEQAAVVLDVLRYEIKSLDIELVLETRITEVISKKGKYEIQLTNKKYIFDSIIVATGSIAAKKVGYSGDGYDIAKKLGHKIIPLVPALVQLKCEENFFKSISGVRTEAKISVFHKNELYCEEQGELQLTDYGISGIPVFQISRVVNYLLRENKKVFVEIDLMPDYDSSSLGDYCMMRSFLQSDRNVLEFFTGIVPKKITDLVLKLCNLNPNQSMEYIEKEDIQRFVHILKHFKVTVIGSNSFEQAQVCAGGIDLLDITDNMESLHQRGIYFVGELLDVDGKCGGYNLQWAWTSGYIAGCAAAKG